MGGFPEPGELFEGKYRIRDLLGSGGFARVYRAEQTDLGREVALKILSPQVSSLASNDSVDSQLESVAIRFEREAKVVSKLRSPYTITVYDYGRTQSGLLYMVLEYVDGLELDEVPRPMEPRRVASVLEQVLKSLQEAHAHELLHRDLKPANIMLYEHLGEKDQVKLLDFGIAKMVGQAQKEKREEQDLTAADSLIGTPRYMSPEQIRGNAVGPAADIYSLGLVIYELLVGEKAITSSDSIEILGKHLSGESFELPAELDVHPEVRAIVNRMLEKDTDVRYATTDEVLADVRALEDIRGDLSGEFANLPPVPDEDVSWSDDLVFEGYEEDEEDGGGIPYLWLGVAAVVVLLGGGSAFFAMQAFEEDDGSDEKPIAIEQTTDSEPAQPTMPEQPAGTEPEPDPEPAPKVAQTGQLTRVETTPAGAMVYVADRLVGEAPAEFGADDFDFPVEVRVELENATVTETLEEPGGTMVLEMERALADARAAQEQEEARERARRLEQRKAAEERRREPRQEAAVESSEDDDKSGHTAEESSDETETESDSEESGGTGYIPLE